jgi:hypothetical protein
MRRRDLLATLGFCLAGSGRRARAGQADATSDEQVIAAATRVLRDAGIDPVRVRTGPNYVAIGDAPASFLKQALDLCEALARDYLDHFRTRGFAVEKPSEKLLIVPLAGPESFSRVAGVPIDEAVGGQYERDTNRLVLFDNRARDNAGPAAARANTVALMHEATHQLCFNTGLLDRQGDTPLAVSEGLACLGETRRPDGRVGFGAMNVERLAMLSGRRAPAPIALPDLIVNDALFEDPSLAQGAYARSWLLIQILLRTPEDAARLRAWLDAIRPRRDASHRMEDARAALGDLDALGLKVERESRRLIR